MYKAVTQVEVQNDYKLLVTFENVEVRTFDMKPFLTKGIYKELLDYKVFCSVKVVFDTIEWCNHADIDPEFLYDYSEPLS